MGLYLASKSVSMHRDFVNTHLLLWATNALEVLVKKIYIGNVKGIEKILVLMKRENLDSHKLLQVI